LAQARRRRRRVLLGDANDITTESVTPAQQAAWYDIIGKFESSASQFQAAMSDLAAQASDIATQDQATQDAYNSLVSRGQMLQNTISGVGNALVDVKNALSGAWTAITGEWSKVTSAVSSALQLPADQYGTQALDTISPFMMGWGASPYASLVRLGLSGGLGLLPLIPIAIVAAAVAALAYWLNDYLQFTQKMALIKTTNAQRAAQGQAPLLPADVAKIMSSGAGGLTASLGSLVWIIGGIAALIFLPKLIGGYRESLR
jgi:hypothetical protein